MKIIKFRIILIISIFVLVTTMNSIGTIVFFKELKDSINNILVSNQESILAAEQMEDILEKIDRDVLDGIVENKSLKVDENIEHEFLDGLKKGEDNITEKGEEELVIKIKRLFKEYEEKVYGLDKKSDKLKYYYEEINKVYVELKKSLRELFELNQEYIVNMNKKAEELAKKSSYYSLTIGGITIFIGGIILIYLLVKILNPIEDLWKWIKKVKEGDLEYKIPLKRDEDINFILEEFNKMVERLRLYERINLNQILREAKKSEGIIESMDIPIIVTDSKNKIIMINKKGEKLFNIERECIIGKPFIEVMKKEEVFKIIKKSREMINYSEYLEEVKFEGDETFYCKVVANQIWFNNKENIGTVTLFQDITKFKEIDKIKTDLLNTISHEFRTPLTSITMAVEILLENSILEDRELLNIIKDEGENLNKLVSELLFLSKLEEGKIKMKIEKVSLKILANEVKNKFKLQLQEKKIILNINIEEETVIGDKEKLSWVLSNLVGNAIRYTNEGYIEIGAKKMSNNKVKVLVKDTGCGINEKNIDEIFNKFFQTGENEGAAGLGLSICKEIIKEHKSELKVISKEGIGSEFYFTL